jgi:uncharacterized membrane protein
MSKLRNIARALLAERCFVPLSLCTAVAFSFLIARGYISGTRGYVFLVKNLFLAWVPYFLSVAATHATRRRSVAALWLAWLAMFPNAPYIFTDLIHWRGRTSPMPWWFDLGTVLMFALAGFFCGVASLRIMHEQVAREVGRVAGWTFVTIVSALSGFGIYLGRFERWNSWDVLTRPKFIASHLLYGLANPFAHGRTLGVTMMFGAMVLVTYVMFVSMNSNPNLATDEHR